MKMIAPYPRKISVKTLHVLKNDFEVREVLFRSNISKTDVCPYCRAVDDTAHFYFPVSHPKNTEGVSLRSSKINIPWETLGLVEIHTFVIKN